MGHRVRFLAPAFIGNRYYAVGDEGVLPDEMALTVNMESLDTGEVGTIIPGHIHEPRFLDHRSDIIMGHGRVLDLQGVLDPQPPPVLVDQFGQPTKATDDADTSG